MTQIPAYLDTSAMVKLVLDEDQSPLVSAYLSENEVTPVSSQLSEVELVRAVSRSNPTLRVQAMELLDRIVLLPISGEVRKASGLLEPFSLRSLDAIHLATALAIRDDLAGLITYDSRMRDAAAAAGLKTILG